MALYSLQIEKYIISGLIRNPNSYADIERFINTEDFVNEVHSCIYSVLKAAFNSGSQIDKTLIAQKAQELGIKFSDQSIDIYNYVNSVCLIPTTAKGVIEAAQELVKYRVRREVEKTGDQLKKFAQGSADKSVDEIITESDKIYNEKICVYANESSKPLDISDGIVELIEHLGDNPIVNTGLVTPYPNFNRLYGGLRKGNLYAWVARPKNGKSTILLDIAVKVPLLNKGCRSLILDTEMATPDVKFRFAAAATGIPMWHLETGNWKKNKELYTQFHENKHKIKELNNLVEHIQVAGKTIEEVASIIKRWYFSKVGRGNPAVVIYDYIKLTGENDKNKQEYQLIGDKVNSLKELSLELDIPILSACQMNRSAEGGVDDSSAIAQSDRLQWFASYVAIFRKKRLEELAEDGESFGSHKMIELATRFQGEDAPGHHDFIRVKNGKKTEYLRNFISFDVRNFDVEEKGTLLDIVKARELRPTLDHSEDDGSL